jgi:hypothetical protein
MSLEQVQELYAALTEAEARLSSAQEELEAAQKHYSLLSKNLGDVLAAVGLSSCTMSDGRTISLTTTYFGSASQERMAAIRQFLASEGSADMCKPKAVKITEEQISMLPEELRESLQYEINTNTLKAWLKEKAKKGELTEEVRQLFNVYDVHNVVVK